MPLRLEIKRRLLARSERVKSVDFHPQEPWILSALFSGHIFIWNYSTKNLVKSLEVCALPLRCAKFVPSKEWIVVGADDNKIRVYNYNTLEKVADFEAHTDYIRCLVVHPTLPYVLSSSDDMTVKLWDWDHNWQLGQTFEGHNHYVMQVEFNPKDTNTFASASLDRSVKIWGLNSTTPHYSLEGHTRGVNCVSYFRGGDRPYLVSGGDDHLVKIWDYQTKACVATLEGHSSNISTVCFHPQLPVLISGSEDGTVRIWHSGSYRLENTLNYGMERAWTASCLRGSTKLAIGYDEGTVMIRLGPEEPVVTMSKGGKVVWTRNHEVFLSDVHVRSETKLTDGDQLPVQTRELGAIELYPQSLKHNPNGRLLVACGDGEYIIYTARSLHNKSFGTALEFVWASLGSMYATRESSSRVKIFKNFAEHNSFRTHYSAEGIFGGRLLAVRSSDSVDFYDWETSKIVRRIEVCPRKIFWSESGEVCVMACESSFFVLRYNHALVQRYIDQGVDFDEDGIEDAFILEHEITEKVRNGYFAGDCFIYLNSAHRLNYYVGGEVMTLAHVGKALYLLGYLRKENRVYLMDKQHNITSYSLLLEVLTYQTAIVRRDFKFAERALQNIPEEHHNRLARFLDAQNLKEMALRVSNDDEHKFELAMQCHQLQLAFDILSHDTDSSDQKWKHLGDVALSDKFDLKLAKECFTRANDLGGLLLIHTTLSDPDGLSDLAELAQEKGLNNIAFICLFLLHRMDECVDLLCKTGRIAEAAFLARTYAPSNISRVLGIWKEDLAKVSVKAAEALADPAETQLAEELSLGLQVEEIMRTQALISANSYLDHKDSNVRNLIEELSQGLLAAAQEAEEPEEPEKADEADEAEEPQGPNDQEPDATVNAADADAKADADADAGPEVVTADAEKPAAPEPEPSPAEEVKTPATLADDLDDVDALLANAGVTSGSVDDGDLNMDDLNLPSMDDIQGQLDALDDM